MVISLVIDELKKLTGEGMSDVKLHLERLKSIPEEYEELMDKAKTEFKQEIDLKEQELGGLWFLKYAEVEAEVDDNGKKKFSNDTKRKAETEIRCSEDADYQALKREVDSLKAQQSQLWKSAEARKLEKEYHISALKTIDRVLDLLITKEKAEIQSTAIMFKD